MAKFNLDNYELVEDRLKKFWKDNPEGRINTDVVSSSDDGTMVIVKAELFISKEDETPVSSGLAQETKGLGGFANNEAWLENCESSAIGRALANWKYQGNKKPRPTQEEMKKVSVPNEVKVEKKTPPKLSKEEVKKMEDIASEMVSDDVKKSPVAEQLNHSLEVMIPDENQRDSLKKRAYNELVNMNVADKDITKWTADNMSTFLTRVEDYLKEDTSEPETTKDIVEEVFGEVTDKSEKVCPECQNSGYIKDNRVAKEEAPDKVEKNGVMVDNKFKNFPDFNCQKNDQYNPDFNGCGKGWYTNNAPTEWL